MRRTAALVMGLVMAATAVADGLDVDLDSYAAAAVAGATGRIAGRVYSERLKPTAPDIPVVSVSIVVVPRSEALLRRLTELREGARDSSTAYREAAVRMRAAREAFEQALWEAGAADLVRTTISDPEGQFSLSGVPAGSWILIARYDTYHEARTRRQSDRERDRYAGGLRLVGYRTHRLWLREADVRRGDLVEFELTDRNIWFTGVIEDRVRDLPRR